MFGQGLDCLKPCYLSLKKINPSVYKRFSSVYIRVPCGHCVNCKIRRTKEWSLRLAMESTQWKNIHFVTLTYDDDNLLYNINKCTGEIKNTLFIKDIQDYIKRVRSDLVRHGFFSSIKYYAVGEYGPKTLRPHYHLLVFGVPDDLAACLDYCWGLGFTMIKDFIPQQCNYVAGYIQKKLYGDDYKYKFAGMNPPFNTQSQHLGEKWFFDKKNLDNTLENGFVMFQGYKHAIPATFRRKLIKMGRLSVCDLVDLRNIQISEYKQLYKHCLDIGVSTKQYWLDFITEANRKVMKKNILRDKEIMSL